MKKTYRLGFAILFVALAWMLLMIYINSRITTFTVQIAAPVDEVRFYQATDPQTPLITITTQAEAVTTAVEMRNTASHSILFQGAPTQYYFVAAKGSESYRSPTICCETGFFNRHGSLTIQDLDNWQQTSP